MLHVAQVDVADVHERLADAAGNATGRRSYREEHRRADAVPGSASR